MKFVLGFINFDGIQGIPFKRHDFLRRSILLYSTSSPSISSTKKDKSNKNNDPCSSSPSIVNYLVDTLGFSTHQSLSTFAKISKQRRLGKSKVVTNEYLLEKATCAVHFFKQLGFLESDIRKIITREPGLLVSKVEDTLEPKIKLLLDLGISESQLLATVSKNPRMLQHKLGPAIHVFKSVLGTDVNVVSMLEHSSRINFRKAVNNLIPNVDLLQTCYGIPKEKIQKFIIQKPNSFTARTDLFRDQLVWVEQTLGIPRDSSMFLYALHLACMKQKTVEDKCQTFKSLGWTQSDLTTLIRLNPLLLTSSEVKIRERLDVLMNQLGYHPSYLACQPVLFTYSLNKRILPRHRILQVLKDKGLVRKDYSLATAATFSEPYFLRKFVLPFEEVRQVYAQHTGSAVGSLPL